MTQRRQTWLFGNWLGRSPGNGILSKSALFPVLATSLDDDPAPDCVAKPLAGLDEHPEYGLSVLTRLRARACPPDLSTCPGNHGLLGVGAQMRLIWCYGVIARRLLVVLQLHSRPVAGRARRLPGCAGGSAGAALGPYVRLG
jgi:hypothetical protein